MKKMGIPIVGALLGAGMVALLTGCGGGEDNLETAYLVDSAVKGVNYRCGDESGVTGADGSFEFKPGQSCTFSIGATQFVVDADKLSIGKKVTPFDIFSGDDEKAINLARMLQSLDSDGNTSNGIEITAATHAMIKNTIDFGSDFDTDFTAETNMTAISASTAIEHLAANVPMPTKYTPFERIAEIDAAAIQTASGFTNPTDQARYVAQKIAKYFNDHVDTGVYSSGDWVLGGSPMTGTADSNITHYNPYILEIPSPDNNKTMIVEVCNKTHAGVAMSMGAEHSPALPCEIAVYTDATTGKIYIDILDPVGSFAIFFNDLTTLTDAQKAAFAAMALQVKTEIKLITYKGLSTSQINHTKKATAMGPEYTPAQIGNLSGQYLTYTYDIDTAAADWNATLGRANANKAALKLIEKMTVNIPAGYTAATYLVSPYVAAGTYGVNGTDLNATLVGNVDYNLSDNAYWRSARKAPLNVPRGTAASEGFIYTVEACSPTHAKTALSVTGDSRDHATALPCQMSFYIDDSNPAAPKLKVVFLNPEFMFQALFKDKLAGLNGTQQQELAAMATVVKNDLVNLTRYVMDNSGYAWIKPNGVAE